MYYFNQFHTYATCMLLCMGIILWSCADEDEDNNYHPSDVPALFSANFGVAATRVTDANQWSTSDKIGVYMLNYPGGSVTDAKFAVYEPTSPGTSTLALKASGDALYYPVAGANVSFVAYAPHTGSAKPTANKVTYPLTSQTSKLEMEKVDFVYCDTKTNDSGSQYFNSGKPSATLNFTHKLSKVIIKVERAKDVTTNLTGLSATVSLPPSVECDLSTGKATAKGTNAGQSLFNASTSKATSAQFEVIVAPHENEGRKVQFKLDGATFPDNLIGQEYEPEHSYTYTYTLTQTDIVLTDVKIKGWEPADLIWSGEYFMSTDKLVTLEGDASKNGYLTVYTDAGAPAATPSGSADWIKFETATQVGTSDEWHIPYTLGANPGMYSRSVGVTIQALNASMDIVVEQQCLVDPLYPVLDIKDANCIIVPPGGHQAFIPVDRVNAFAAIYNKYSSGAPTISTSTTGLYATLLWTDGISDATASSPVSKDLVMHPLSVIRKVGFIGTGSAGYVYVQSGSLPGNAVVALRNSAGTILWSWHIWVTGYNPDLQADWKYYTNNAGTPVTTTFMDRNLGATTSQKGTVGSLGLLYQWGRKDPEIGGSAINSTTPKYYWHNRTTTGTTWTHDNTWANGGAISILASVQSPHTHNYPSGGGDWSTQGVGNGDEPAQLRWEQSTGKGIDDPCPLGWKVPVDGTWAGLSHALPTAAETATSFHRDDIYLGRYRSDMGWWPAAGLRYNNSVTLYNVGSFGYYWSATRNGTSLINSYYLSFLLSTVVSPSNYHFRSHGLSVRCVRE